MTACEKGGNQTSFRLIKGVAEAMVCRLPVTGYTDELVTMTIERVWARIRDRLSSGRKDPGTGDDSQSANEL